MSHVCVCLHVASVNVHMYASHNASAKSNKGTPLLEMCGNVRTCVRLHEIELYSNLIFCKRSRWVHFPFESDPKSYHAPKTSTSSECEIIQVNVPTWATRESINLVLNEIHCIVNYVCFTCTAFVHSKDFETT